MRAVFLAGLVGLLPAGAAFAADKPCFEDAALHAVQFVDASEGWAVGDEGVVWHTIDGGKTWERQATGVRASLRGVHFLNPFTGWAVGRIELPGGKSEGVVLTTNSGGEKWQRALHGTLPGLNGVRFVRDLEGYLFGDGSDLHPSGLFRTEDGGRSWHPVPGPRTTTWRAGTFTPAGTGTLGGAWNRLAVVENGRVASSSIDSLGGRSVCGVYASGKQALAVGQGGLILHSEAGGENWRFIELKGLDAVRPVWDFHAVAGVGERVWVAGRPGSAVLHSPDLGKTWQVQRTGQAVPLNGLFFLDAKVGFAVGEFGTILATPDGGATWRLQRRGGQRAAVLAVNARAERVPLDTLASLGGADGYLSVALQAVAPDAGGTDPVRTYQPYRVAAGARAAGGAAGEMLWAFPLPAHLSGTGRADVLAAWNRRHGDRARENLLAQMVLALRMWRPSLVLADGPDATLGLSPVEEVVAETLRQALSKAGDPTAYPEQIEVLGLEAWKAAKVYQQTPARNEAGVVLLDNTEFAALLGTTARDQATQASAALLPEAVPAPRLRGYQLVHGPEDARDHRHLMQGIDLNRGGLARRTLVPADEDADERKQVVQQATQLQALVESPSPELADPNKLLAPLGSMLEKLPGDLAARTGLGVAAQLARNGQWALAREVYALVANRYPAHPQAAAACRWLIQYHASGEARRRRELNQFLHLKAEEFGAINGTEKTPASPAAPKVETTREDFQATLVERGDAQRWLRGALELEKALAAHGPLHYLDPSVQMALLSVKRQLGDVEEARKGYALLASRQPEGAWKAAAQAELWLLDRTGESPRPVVGSQLTEARPHLDGKLDDACWQTARPLPLRNAVGEPAARCPTEVRIAHDREYLYVAVACKHPQGKSVEPARPRLHDKDLRAFDRVSLVLDVDRDYATAFHFQIDQRGCLAEDCWGDRGWDPRWFVARQHDETGWTVEMAIPLEGLTTSAPTPGTVWAFNVIRTTPGVGVQAVSPPAEAPEEALRPEGLGLLLFQDAKKPTP